ncbi:hypothetical protein ES703_89839 [subsurface metagenome]
MHSASLICTELIEPGLYAHVLFNHGLEHLGDAAKLSVAETVFTECSFVCRYILSLFIFKSLACNDKDPAQFLEHFFDIADEFVEGKGSFGQIYKMRCIFGTSSGKACCCRYPAGVSSHHLQNRAGIRCIECLGVPAGLSRAGCDIFCHAGVARTMVGAGKVVIDRLWNAHTNQLVAGVRS